MSKAEELLYSLTEPVPQHKHPVPDSDTYFLIDPYTRLIENTSFNKTVLMQGDHNSERFTFELPRYIDGHDMSLCNRVIVHFDNVGDTVEHVHSDVAYPDDFRLNPDGSETVICSWLIRREATQFIGILSFSLQYLCVEDDGTVSYEWNTDSCDAIEIRKSKNNGETAVINYTNVLEQWRSQIFGAGDSVMASISSEGANQVAAVQSESASQQAAIELKGAETLATIPDDYTEVYNMASEAVRTKADSLVCEAEGEAVVINDASNDYIRGLTIYGKSTQNTTTGKNLLNLNSPSRSYNGITYTVQDDGGIRVTGTSTGNSWFTPGGYQAGDERLSYLPAGTYFLSGNKSPVANVTGYINGYYEDGTAIVQTNDTGSGRSFTLNRDAYVYYQIMIGPDVTVDTVIYPQIEAGNAATSWEPYTGGIASPNPEYPQEIISIENPTVTITGKNLARSNRDGTLKSVGITVAQVNNSSEIVVNGTATSATSVTVLRDIYLHAGHYTLSVYGLNTINESYDRAYIMDGTSNAIVNYVQPGRPQAFNISEPKYITISIVFAEGTVYNNKSIKFQLEEGSVATDYESYVRESVTLNRTLPGIPVSSGGNYTDSDGQQWICDEIDLEREVYVQRVNTYTISGNETMNASADKWQKDGMFSVYMNALSPATEYASDNVGLFHYALSEKCTANTWEWMQHAGLNNIAARKSIVYISLANSITGILAEDDNSVKLSKFKAYLAAQYTADTPITIQYILATPIESPLTAEEIIAYKALKTNHPNTTIFNDAGAWMKVKYNADIKRYVEDDNQKLVADIMDQVRVGVTPAKIGTVTLLASAWKSNGALHSQIVNIEGVTENSQVDLTPNVEQLAIFYDKDISFVTENNGGVVTVYAIGQKPTNDYTIQVTITEVEL